MKSLAIIIPVNRPERGKSRLASVLDPHDRLALNHAMLNHTFDEVTRLSDIADIYAVTKSPEVRAQAAMRGFVTSGEPETCDLNDAIKIGVNRAREAGALEIMVLPVDLPRLSTSRLRSVIQEFRDGPDVLIITDDAGTGTNVLLWRPIASASFQYGIGSAERHARSAERLGLRVVSRKDDALSFDVDTPQDLEQWSKDDHDPSSGRSALTVSPSLTVDRGDDGR